MATDPLSNSTIILLEDDEFLSEVIVKKFEALGADIKRYRNGLEGLAAIREFHPHLVLLDIMMPVMNGYEVLEVMNAEHLIDTVPVIVVSNSGQPVEIDRLLDLGVKEYVVKVDFTPEEVIEKARAVLQNKTAGPITGNGEPAPEQKNELRVLVIEDDPLLKNLLSVKLTASGCLPLYVDDGTKALENAKSFEPDVVLLDLMIPGIDGFEVLEQFMKDESLRNTPVFVFSNKSSEEDKERAFSLGAKVFKQKAETNLSEVVDELYKLAGRVKNS